MADLADIAAAETAGYRVTRLDRGAGAALPRYFTTLEKWLVGDVGQSGSNLRAYGESDVSDSAADDQALDALNAQRKHRYAGLGSHGGTMTEDVT